MAIEIKPKSKPNHIELASYFLYMLAQGRVFHTQSLSLSQHLAFEEFYQLADNFYDTFIEFVQGKEQMILKDFKSYSFKNLEEHITPIKELINKINSYRSTLSNEYVEIDNKLQEFVGELDKIMYKLKFLK